jgi:N utilization substance protein B
MQSLFAYEQCKEANYLLARDQIETRFSPDLNSMEVQDKPVLSKKKKEALQLFDERFNGTSITGNDDVNDAVTHALTFLQKQSEGDFRFLHKNLVIEIEKLNASYHSILSLVVSLAEVEKAEKKQEAKVLSENSIIAAISKCHELNKHLLKENSGWDHRMDKVRAWFREVIKPDKTYAQFSSSESNDLEEQKAIVKHLVRKLILGPTVINDHFEEEDIRWSEDKDILKSLVDKTIKSFDPESQEITLQKLSLDWEDDKAFIDKIFETAAHTDSFFKDLIAKNTKNWEVDRLPLIDRVIIEMAIAELIGFPGIPIKVSINEYIELAKHYSTPKSRQFINGILDVIAKELVGQGKIKKSGRGLLDNK